MTAAIRIDLDGDGWEPIRDAILEKLSSPSARADAAGWRFESYSIPIDAFSPRASEGLCFFPEETKTKVATVGGVDVALRPERNLQS